MKGMYSMHLLLPHALSQENAIYRIKALSDRLAHEHKNKITSLDQNWNGNQAEIKLKAMGMTFRGSIQVTARDISINLNLPLAAVLLKKQIKQEITKHLKNNLS